MSAQRRMRVLTMRVPEALPQRAEQLLERLVQDPDREGLRINLSDLYREALMKGFRTLERELDRKGVPAPRQRKRK